MSDFNAGPPASSASNSAAGDAAGDASSNGGSGDYLSALAQVKALAARASQAQMQRPPQPMMPMGQPPFMRPPQPMMSMSQQAPMPGTQPLLQQPQQQQQQEQQQEQPMVKRGADETEGAPEAKRPPSSSSPPSAPKMTQPPLMSQPPPMVPQLGGGQVPSISAGAQQKSQQSQGQKEPELAPGEEVDNVMIPSEKVGMVIGKGGEKINWLQEQSGARLQMIQDDPYAKEKPLRMVGTREKIERAKKLVKDLIDPEPEDDPLYPRMGGLSSGDIVSNLSAYRSKTVQVKVPRVAVGRVIGRGGETIKRIQAETGARVQFEQENNQEFRTATVSGTVAVIEEAEKMIMDIIREAEVSASNYGRGSAGASGGGAAGGAGSGQQRPRDDRPREPMLVPGERAGLIIGRGGDSIRNIMQQSGAHISLDRQIPPTASGEKTFMITGNPDEIATAKRLIQEKLDSYRPNYRSRGPPTSRGPPGMQSSGFPQHFGGFPGQPQQGVPPGQQPQQQQQQQNPPHFGGGYQGHGGGGYQHSYGYNQQQPYQQQYQQHQQQPPPPPTQPPPPPGQQQHEPPQSSQQQQQYHQHYYQQQQQQQQPPPSSSAPSQQQQQQPSASQPSGQPQQQQQQQQQQQAVPPGYPTHEQYLQYKEWYNAQGYYGYPPSQA